MSVGNRIFLKRHLPSRDIVEGLGAIPASNIGDCMGRSNAMNPRIRLMSHPRRTVSSGLALTVKVRAGDNLLIHAALEMAGEGDVLVVSNENDDSRALMGEIMITYCWKHKRLAGLVLDGPIRDADAVSLMDFPVYATGTTPGGPYKEGPGEINVPIACGEVGVYPGDIVVMDSDGVLVVPRKGAQSILEAATALQKKDVEKVEAAKRGGGDRSWVAEALRRKDVEVVDGYFEE